MAKNDNGFSFGMGSHNNIKATEIVNTRHENDIDNMIEEDAVKIEKPTVDTNGKITITAKKSIVKKSDMKVSTSLALTPEASELLTKANKMNADLKANTTINMVLEGSYNPTTKGFNADIPVKPVLENINYSVQIARKYRDALAKEAKKRNMSTGEYLSELIKRKLNFDE